MAKNGQKYKDRVDAYLEQLGLPASNVVCKDKANVGKYLFDIFVWQEISRRSKKELEAAWKRGQDPEVLPSDEDLRSLGQGEHIVLDSDHFSCIVTVNKPRSNFKLEKFLLELTKRYKQLKYDELLALANTCKEPGAPPLEKRIVEV